MADKKLKKRALAQLGDELDKESWFWLLQQHAEIAAALENAVSEGAGIDEIRQLAWVRTQRPEIVTRLENATRYLLTLED